MATHATTTGPTSYETDRSKFLGRCSGTRTPAAIGPASPLSDSQGSVLDPIAAIRSTIVIEPDQSAVVDFVTGIAATREAALALAERYSDRHLADRVYDLAWTHSQVMLQHLGVTEADAQLFGRLASAIVYPQTAWRAAASILAKNRRGQSGLWGYGISGDLPIVLLRIGEVARIDLVRQLVRAHGYWRSKGLAVDLVIWNEDHSGYRQALHDEIMGVITGQAESQTIERPGGIFVRRAEQVPEEDRVLFESVARIIISRQWRLAGRTDRPSWPNRNTRCHTDAGPPGPLSAGCRRRGGWPVAAVQRPRRICGRRPGICHHHLGRQPHTGSLGQRVGQRPLRHGRQRVGLGLYLERKRPRIPADSLVQRPGHRRRRRSFLSSR